MYVVSQKQMKEWIPGAIKDFQEKMPPVDIPYPEIHIVTDRTMIATRNALLEKTQSPTKIRGNAPAMETLHGPGGNAILIYQKGFRGQIWDDNPQEMFTHFLWHELGHFYVLSKEDPNDNFIRFMDQKPHPDEYEALLGYWFWSEFIAEAIACRMEPDVEIEWKDFDWYTPRNRLIGYLNGAFNTSDNEVGVYDLAFYFARLLSDKTTVRFIEAAKTGRLKVRDSYLSPNKKTFSEAGIDPTGLDGLDTRFAPYIQDLKEYMECILSEKEYWKIELEDLKTIGLIICAMNRIMFMDVAAERLKERISR